MKKTAGTIRQVLGKGLRIGIVVSRFNEGITKKLLQGAEKILKKKNVLSRDIEVVWVPGAFEIPMALQQLARRKKKFDALIALGVVIRGRTPHFDYVARGAMQGIMQVSLKENIPISFGVLTTDNVRQALDRAGGRCGNKGEESALVALEMGSLLRSFADSERAWDKSDSFRLAQRSER